MQCQLIRTSFKVSQDRFPLCITSEYFVGDWISMLPGSQCHRGTLTTVLRTPRTHLNTRCEQGLLQTTLHLGLSAELLFTDFLTFLLWPFVFSHPLTLSSSFLFSFPSCRSLASSMAFLCFSPPVLSPLFTNVSIPPCSIRDKFVEVDLKPVCKHCYERLPDDMKRRLAKRERDSKEKKKKPLIPMCL